MDKVRRERYTEMSKKGMRGEKQKELNEFDVIKKIERLTYPQEWKFYNLAKTREKIIAQALLLELLDYIEDNRGRRVGRPSTPLKEKILCMFLYSYNGVSSRIAISDLEMAKRANLLSKTYHFNTVSKFFNDAYTTRIISQLIELTALPLISIEKNFAIDASGFSTSRYDIWFNIRTQKISRKRHWKKAHLYAGTKTHIITNVSITHGTAGDSPELIPLVEKTAKFFDMRELSADMAYSSRKNLTAIASLGTIPYIPFKRVSIGKRRGSFIWSKMWKFFQENREEFMGRYHRRSNIESVYSMIKRRFGNYLKMKKDVSQINEILMKCLCHNLAVLVQESFELGLEIDFKKCVEYYSAHK